MRKVSWWQLKPFSHRILLCTNKITDKVHGRQKQTRYRQLQWRVVTTTMLMMSWNLGRSSKISRMISPYISPRVFYSLRPHALTANFSLSVPTVREPGNTSLYTLNGEYISNRPPWRIRHCTLASHLTCPNCYNIMNPHGLCDLPLLFNSLFHDTTLNWARMHFESQHQKSGIYCLPVSVILHHSLHFVGI